MKTKAKQRPHAVNTWQAHGKWNEHARCVREAFFYNDTNCFYFHGEYMSMRKFIINVNKLNKNKK